MRTFNQTKQKHSRKTYKKTGYKLLFDETDIKPIKTVEIGWYIAGLLLISALIIFLLK